MNELDIYAFVKLGTVVNTIIYKKVQLVKKNNGLFWFAPLGGTQTMLKRGDLVLQKNYELIRGCDWWFEFDEEDFEEAAKNSIGELNENLK